MYRVRATTVPLAPAQRPSMSAHGKPAPTTGSRDRDNAHRKRQPRNAEAKGSSKRRVVAAHEDSVALQRATTVAVRLTVSCILLFPPPSAPDPWPGTVPCHGTRLVHHFTSAAFVCPTPAVSRAQWLERGTSGRLLRVGSTALFGGFDP
jgi:hypothetical protein